MARTKPKPPESAEQEAKKMTAIESSKTIVDRHAKRTTTITREWLLQT